MENKEKPSRDKKTDKQGKRKSLHNSPISKPDWNHIELNGSSIPQDIILDNINDGVYILDRKGYFVFVNKIIEKRIGLPLKIIYRTHYLDLVHEDEHDYMKKYFESTIKGEPVPLYTFHYYRDDEKTFIYEVNTRPIIKEGEVIGLLGISRNITERQEVEDALRESEDLYKTLVKTFPDPVIVTDLEGKILEVSDQALSMNRYDSKNEIIGRNALELILPEDHERALKNLQRTLDEGFIRNTEYKLLRKDGTHFISELNASLVRDSDGQPRAFIATVRDITEHKKHTEEMNILQKKLFHAQKMEATGTLAGGIAHDFNNILMGIQGNTSLLFHDMEEGKLVRERLMNIEEYIRSGMELTRQLLGFARGGKYEVKPIDLNGLLNKSVDLFGRTHKDIIIYRKFQDTIPSVEVDQGQIEQVILNLLVNAWQAMPGGGNLYLKTELVKLDENFIKPYDLKPGSYVKISIMDTGIGMDEETRQKIFDPFFTTKEGGRGTGLGLASAYGIITSHLGIITVDSVKGTGTTMNIYLPASRKSVSAKKTAPNEVLKGEGTILIIDDEEMIIDVSKQMLEIMGFSVLTAQSGIDALEIFRKQRESIDLVILDMVMPDMWGGETFKQLKEIDPDVKVLLSSGYSSSGKAEEILKLGCKGFIQKPYTMKDISRKIREILG